MFLSHWIRSVANQLQHSPASPFPSDQTLALGLTRLEDRRVLSVSGADVMLFSVEGAAVTLPGNVQAEGADIVAYDGSEFQLYLDGSDVGLDGADIDGFAVAGENQFLLSFANATTVAGLGTVDSRDIIQFSASSVGEDTAGTFSWVLHGENFGLPELPPGNIDALEVLDDGSIVFSIAGNSSLPIGPDDGMVSTQDSDLFRLTPDANGDFAMANLELYFDGSDVGLSGTIEDVDAVAINGSQWRFSTTSSFFVNGQTLGSGGDVFTFNAVKLGDVTSGTFDPGLDFDGSMVTGLGFNLDALDFATITPPNAPPSAQDVSADVSEDGSVAVQLLGNDGDVNADQPLTYQIVDGPDFGQVSNFDPATGTLTYTPNADYAGSDQIVYLVQETDADGNVLSSEVATVSLTVNAVNDAPILQVAQSQFSGNEGQSIVIHGLAVDDLEAVSQQSQVVVTLQAGDGALSLAESTSVAITGNGSGEVQLTGTVADINLLLAQGVTFQPNAEFAGTSAVSITLQDDVNAGNALVTTASLQLQILAIPDQPSPITFQERVLQLLGNAELNFGQANTLLNAIRHEGGHGLADKAAHKVEKWERQGRIGSELADELVGWLQDLDANADGHHHHHGHKHGHHKHSHDHHGHNLAHGHHGHHHNHKNDHGHGHKAGHDHHHGPLHNLVDAIFSQIANGRHCGRFRV